MGGNAFDELEGLTGFGDAADGETPEVTTEGEQAGADETNVVKNTGKASLEKSAEAELTAKMEDPEFLKVRDSRANDIEIVRTFSAVSRTTQENVTQAFMRNSVKAGTLKVLAEDDKTPLEVTVKDGLAYGTTKMGANDNYIVPVRLDGKLDGKGKHRPLRQLGHRPAVVGYLIKNVSSTPLEYTTEVWTKNEEGKFVSEQVTKILAPNETAQINKKWLAMLGARVEHNNTFANGILVLKGIFDEKANLDDIINGYFFKFSDPAISTYDPEYLTQIDKLQTVQGEDKKPLMKDGKPVKKAVLNPEFEPTFGYLNNAPEKVEKPAKPGKTAKTGTPRNKVAKPSKQELAAIVMRKRLGL